MIIVGLLGSNNPVLIPVVLSITLFMPPSLGLILKTVKLYNKSMNTKSLLQKDVCPILHLGFIAFPSIETLCCDTRLR